MTSLLTVRGVAKRYGAVRALESVDLEVAPGETHALLGANGAGKSTLVKILSGLLPPDEGEILLDGRPVDLATPARARARGIAPVFQDPALAPDLTVRRNLVLTGTDLDAYRRWAERAGVGDVAPGRFVRDLPLAVLRMIDLARALAHDPRLLVLDEITAALPTDLAERVAALMAEVRADGRSVLFISHRLTEVQTLCDRATVLRDGRAVDTHRTGEGGEARVVAAMLGAAARPDPEPPAVPDGEAGTEPGEVLLSVRGLAAGLRLTDVGLDLRAGEVLGVVALESQGQDELFAVLAGDQRPRSGTVTVRGTALAARHPRDAVRRGLAYVPSDRRLAVLPQRSVAENLTLPLFAPGRAWWRRAGRRDASRVRRVVDALRVDVRAGTQARRLSGGNQQKLTVGRWLVAGFDVLVCFDPTRGIDVGSKRDIYALLRAEAAAGRGVLLFTSELREVGLVCDRVLVLHDGRIVDEMPAARADEARLLEAAHGLLPGAAA